MNSDVYYKKLLENRYGGNQKNLVLTNTDIFRVHKLFKYIYPNFVKYHLLGLFETELILNTVRGTNNTYII